MADTKINIFQNDLNNQTGSHTELIYATTQGKNAIATALTNKGVATDASETLIQMADKITDLSVENNTSYILGYYMDVSSLPSKVSSGANHLRVFRNSVTGERIILKGTNIYYIPDGLYNSVEELISASTHTIDVTAENAEYTLESQTGVFAISEDFTKLIVEVDTTQHTCLIYNISKETGFQKLSQVDKNFYPYNNLANGVGIHDSGNYIFYQNTVSEMRVYNVENSTEYTFNKISGGGNYLFKSIIKPSTIYYLMSGTTATQYHAIQYVNYTVQEDGSIVFGTVNVTAQEYTSNDERNAWDWLHEPGVDDVPMLYIGRQGYQYQPSSINNALCETKRARVWIPETNSKMNPIVYRYIASNSGTGRIAEVLSVAGLYKLECTEQTFTLKFAFIHGDITINRTTGEISYPNDFYSYATWILNQEIRGTRALCYSSNKLVLGNDTSSNNVENYIGQDITVIPFSETDDEKVFAIVRKINNSIAYYAPYINYENLKSGAYDKSTIITPAV